LTLESVELEEIGVRVGLAADGREALGFKSQAMRSWRTMSTKASTAALDRR
jgi:hypothetical protein